MRQQRAGTVTFVFTDIEGSTMLVKRLRERWPEVRSAHRRIVRDAFEAHGGDEVDTQGDSFFYVFGRARDAALAAADAQRGLAAHEWPEDGVIRIRIGMHTGEPVVSEEGYHGIGVHRAARIMAAGHGGQVLLSEATAAVLADEEVSGVEVRDLGVHRLKDLDRPEHVYQLVAEGLRPSFPKIRTAGAQKPFHKRPLVIGAAAGVLAAAVAIPVFAFAGSSGPTTLPAAEDNSVGVVDPSSRALVADAPGVSSPLAVAGGAGAVWVTGAGGTVSKIDPQTHAVLQTIGVGDGPQGLAVSGDSVWVANSLDGNVSRINAGNNQVVHSYKVGNTPIAVAVGDGSVWVANAGDGTVTQLDATTGARKQTIPVGGTLHGIAFGGGALWVTDRVGNAVVRIPVNSPSSQTRITNGIGSGPTAIAYRDGQVWVTNSLDGTASRIDAGTSAVTGTFPTGPSPNGVAVTPGKVWVADEGDGKLVQLDAKTGSPTPLTLSGRPEGVGTVNGSVYVAVQAAGVTHRGGDLRILEPLMDSMDPQITYFTSTWALQILLGDGLTGLKRAGGTDGDTLVPDLATSLPQPTDNGRTYTFQLHDGIRFSNGKTLRPSDVRATFERMFRAYDVDDTGHRMTTARPDYYVEIVGAPACKAHPKTCDLSRGIVTDDAAGTVTFHLSAPDPDFLYRLALPFAFILPRGTPVGPGLKLPSTGPYMVAAYHRKAFLPRPRAVLKRNPYFHVWSPTAQPDGFPDQIDVTVGRPTTKNATLYRLVGGGRADFDAAGLEPSLLAQARTLYPTQLYSIPGPNTMYVWLNARRRPFSSALAREAVAYALDRRRLVAARGGSSGGTVTCQFLPPGFTGYVPYCPFTAGSGARAWRGPDLARARADVARSGTRGARVHLITTLQTSSFTKSMAAVADTMRALGYRVSVTSYPADGLYFNALSTKYQTVDAAISGWTADYPTAASFFSALSCSPAPYVCTPALDRAIKQAGDQAQASGSSAPWTALDRQIAKQALLVNFMNSRNIDFVSKRVGNYQYSPIFGALLDQLWVR